MYYHIAIAFRIYGQFHRKCYHRVKQMKVTYNVRFPPKINEEDLHFDDELTEVKKVGNNMTSISFSAIKICHILQEL